MVGENTIQTFKYAWIQGKYVDAFWEMSYVCACVCVSVGVNVYMFASAIKIKRQQMT